MGKKVNDDNRSKQLNPEHDAYWKGRGLDGRPEGQAPDPASPAPASPAKKG